MRGVKFVNPGVKTDVNRIMDKLEKYDGAADRVTDLARGTFIAESPQQADRGIYWDGLI